MVLRQIPTVSTQLKARKLAVEVGTYEHFLLDKALRDRFKLTIKDIELIPLTTEEVMKAFIAGALDGAALYEPFLSQVASEGKGTIVWTTKDSPGYMTDVLVVNDATPERHASHPTHLRKYRKPG